MASTAESALIKKSKIIAMLGCGRSKKEIMEEVGCDRKFIKKWSKRFSENGEDGLIDKRKNNKGPRVTTAEEDSRLFNVAAERPFQSIAKTIEDANLSISVRTGERRLNGNGLENKPTAKRAELSQGHLQNRLQHARDHVRWTQEQWNAIIWSDEKSFKSSMDNRKTVWRPKGQRLNPKYVTPNWHSNRISSMFWGCMSAFGVMELVHIGKNFNSADYIEILETVMLPAARRVFPAEQYPTITFMQDNAAVHTARVVDNWFANNPDIILFRHPPLSPDLNPIENIWNLMEHKWTPGNRPRNEVALRNRVVEVWEELRLRPDYCTNIVNSMHKRMLDVIENDGYWIKY